MKSGSSRIGAGIPCSWYLLATDGEFEGVWVGDDSLGCVGARGHSWSWGWWRNSGGGGAGRGRGDALNSEAEGEVLDLVAYAVR